MSIFLLFNSNFSWDFLIKRTELLLQSNNYIDLKIPNIYYTPPKSIANILYLRGEKYQTVNLESLQNKSFYVNWNDNPFKAFGSSQQLTTFPLTSTIITYIY